MPSTHAGAPTPARGTILGRATNGRGTWFTSGMQTGTRVSPGGNDQRGGDLLQGPARPSPQGFGWLHGTGNRPPWQAVWSFHSGRCVLLSKAQVGNNLCRLRQRWIGFPLMKMCDNKSCVQGLWQEGVEMARFFSYALGPAMADLALTLYTQHAGHRRLLSKVRPRAHVLMRRFRLLGLMGGGVIFAIPLALWP